MTTIPNPLSHEELMRLHVEEMHRLDLAIETALFGPFDATLGENVRREADGIVHKVDAIYKGRKALVGSLSAATVALIADVVVRVTGITV